MARFRQRTSFTVPVTNAQYAPERITFGAPPSPVQGVGIAEDVGLIGLCFFIESNAATGAVLELWFPKLGATGIDADYAYSGVSSTTGFTNQFLSGISGAQLRAKSVGVAGAMVVNAFAV